MDIELRFEAARFLDMKCVGMAGDIPMFEGTPEQFARFHKYIGTPQLV